ncbi:MAG: corrinoid protein [Oscillospiraceae bacterium]|jgi:corrinoid protein of di/trimethylamine methyltransferase|nr:corrinoid protein [Oscillospiraceae bacterium]
MSIFEDISSYLQKGRMAKVKELVQQALDEGESPKEILEEGLLSGMNIIGGKFKNNEVFVPEVLVAARAMNAGVALLKQALVESGVTSKGRAVIGTVKGDMHDIGKNLVKLMLEGKGIEVIDLGVDVSSEKFVAAICENKPQLVCCSALLTTTMGEMKNIVEAIKQAGLRDQVKIMVGGAPITQKFCESVGADAYTADAASAADRAIEFCLEMIA